MSEITMREGNNLNNLERNNHPNRSKFNFTDALAFTPLFGQISPFFCRRTEDTDSISNRAELDLRTFTLKSPLMQDLKMYKNYFSVPMECILPNNWKTKIYPNPTVGDDVPSDAYTFTKVGITFAPILASSLNFSKGTVFSQSNIFTALVTLNNIFNSGSLANVLGYGFVRFDVPELGSALLEISKYVTEVRVYSYDGITSQNDYIYNVDLSKISSPSDKLHRLISLVSDYPCLLITQFPLDYDNTQLDNFIKAVGNSFLAANNGSLQISADLCRLWAYQIVCAHFYSNDKVDFIYNAELFRQSIFSIYGAVVNNPNIIQSFNYNGMSIQYDYLSARYVELAARYITDNEITISSPLYTYYLRYLNSIFSYRRSLKYEDYFTGARPRPLAIGNDKMPVEVSVANNTVSVVDITRSIQAQKFLNQVNRVGRKFSNYLAGLFGKAPADDWHDPKFLASMKETIYGQETRNTGNEQFLSENSITTNLRCDSNNFEVTADFDRQCIMLGLVSFDIVRYYDNSTVRDTLVEDRYDMFNPYMQFIGDQALYSVELDRTPKDGELTTRPFAYSTRYLDLKTSFPRACGAFATNALPSWLFKASDMFLFEAGKRFPTINPDYIRSYPAELDDYFLNGTGTIGASWFHFILLVKNNVTAIRPMAVNPQILG